ncbi:MAG: tetratricopeptide repeat protein [Pleurocapsa sp.]
MSKKWKWLHIYQMGRILGILWLIGSICLTSKGSTVVAETKLSNPLDSTLPDPLLPSQKVKRPLSSFEKYRIKREIVKLDREAKTELESENGDRAFSLWYRVLRLQRRIGVSEEVVALGNIGEIAWSENRGEDVRMIFNRLEDIQQQAKKDNNLDSLLLNNLGTAYQQVRYLDQAISIYQQLLVKARKDDSLVKERDNLEVLGKLHLARFDYNSAAPVYQELLKLNNTETNENYLKNLRLIYDHTAQLDKSIAIKKELAEIYLDRQQITELATIQIDIADDYTALQNTQQAEAYYQQALSLAESTKQLAIASQALTKLAILYRQRDRIEKMISTYQELITIQQQTYDLYGWMDSCDRLAQIYQVQGNLAQAKDFWQQGLQLAQTLNYRVNYFEKQLNN